MRSAKPRASTSLSLCPFFSEIEVKHTCVCVCAPRYNRVATPSPRFVPVPRPFFFLPWRVSVLHFLFSIPYNGALYRDRHDPRQGAWHCPRHAPFFPSDPLAALDRAWGRARAQNIAFSDACPFFVFPAFHVISIFFFFARRMTIAESARRPVFFAALTAFCLVDLCGDPVNTRIRVGRNLFLVFFETSGRTNRIARPSCWPKRLDRLGRPFFFFSKTPTRHAAKGALGQSRLAVANMRGSAQSRPQRHCDSPAPGHRP